ncbi:MAG: class I SAM-dependent methyltransferase [Sneathiella sp.]|nr:class I SAM-dependent methyltransferase [Sneathiella sp.]
MKSLSEKTISCLVCYHPVTYIGDIDSNRSAADAFVGKRVFRDYGEPIPYHQCTSCKLIFSNHYASWCDEDYSQFIYNSDYHLVDPPFENERPISNAEWLHRCILSGNLAGKPSILDYGAGNGRFLQELQQLGYQDLAGIDKFCSFSRGDLSNQYDIVTCFEVLEHSLDPAQIIKDCINFLKEGGTFFFSTLLLPQYSQSEVLSWWYIAPRNGHICIHTEESLQKLTPPGFQVDCSSFRDIHTIARSDVSLPFSMEQIAHARRPYLPGKKS